jgi:hypothetical protein
MRHLDSIYFKGDVLMKKLYLAVIAILLLFSPANVLGADAKDGKIIQDAEFYILEAQNA